MSNNTKFLDCTLRDGGQGLEDFFKSGVTTPIFTADEKRIIAEKLRDSQLDIVEIGAMGPSHVNRAPFAIYQNIESLSAFLPQRQNPNQMFVGLYIGPDTDMSQIPEHSPELVDGVRVILRYSELKKSLDYCAALAKKGYQVFVQPMLTMRYSDEEIHRIVDSANEMGAFALYIVDSYGYMAEQDINRLFHLYDRELNPEVHIGFHAHNNSQLAFSNVRYFLEQLPDRKKIIDSCVMGMGQGAGNMQTELLVSYLNRQDSRYQLEPILEVCDILQKFRPHAAEEWGYAPERMLASVHRAAYKYASAMRLKGMSLVEIHHVLGTLTQEQKYRYTPESLSQILAERQGLCK